MSEELKKECNCAEMSCKEDCVKTHTHKGFWCEKCHPERYGKELKKEWEVDLDNDLFLKQWSSVKGANKELVEHIKFIVSSLLAKQQEEFVKCIPKELIIESNWLRGLGYNDCIADIKSKLNK
jgi:hypothetical protein